MMKQRIHFLVLCVVIFVALYAVSLRIYQSYQNTIKVEAQLAQELPSTDLSSLSIHGYKLGEEIRIVPYEGWEDDKIPWIYFTLEDGTRERLRDIYYIGGISSSKLKGILVTDFSGVAASYNGESILNLTLLQDFLEDSYIEIAANGFASRSIIYIDHKNSLILTLDTDESGESFCLDIEEFNLNEYVNYQPGSNVSIWRFGRHPFFVTPRVLRKLDYDYTIFRPRNHGFTKSELFTLPIYYFILFLPVLALIVFRSKKLLYLNSALAAFYILWWVAAMMYYWQF